MNIVTQSLEYYDHNKEKYNAFTHSIKYYSHKQNTSDTSHSTITFYDKNKKEILTSRAEILGAYFSKSRTWAWSWSIPTMIKNSIQLSRKILNYGLDLIVNKTSSNELFLKSELITSRFKITDPIQLDIHSAIASYISKTPIVIPMVYKIGDDGVELIDGFLIPYSGDVSVVSGGESGNDQYYVEYWFILDHKKLIN